MTHFKQKLIPLLLLCWLSNMAWSQCLNPVLSYNTMHSLCENDTATLHLSAFMYKPQGCKYNVPSSPFDLYGPNGAVAVSPQSNVFTLNTTPAAGNYYVRTTLIDSVPGSCPCVGTYTSNAIAVKATPQIPLVTVVSNGCIGNPATLTASYPTFPAPAAVNYLWYENTNPSQLVYNGLTYTTQPLTSANQIYYAQSELNGCYSDRRVVNFVANIVPPPIPDSSLVRIYCNNFATLRAVPASANGGATVYWYSDPNLSTVVGVGSVFTTSILNSDQTYYAATHEGNCKSSAIAINVDVRSLTRPAPVPTVEICEGGVLTLSATSTNANAAVGNFEWYSSMSGGNSIYMGNPYIVPNNVLNALSANELYVLENIQGCKSDKQTISFSIRTLPITPSIIASDNQPCEGDILELQAQNANATYTYYWTGPNNYTSIGSVATIPNINATNEGVYTLVVSENTTPVNCLSEAGNTFIEVLNRPQLSFPSNLSVTDGENLQILVAGANTYSWSPSDYISSTTSANPIFSPPALISADTIVYTYYVTGTNLSSFCETTDSVNITLLPRTLDDGLIVYNVITPNGDGKNDVWNIDFLYANYDCEIFIQNREGVTIWSYSGSNYNSDPWDGRVKGEYRNDGTYRYSIHLRTPIDKYYSGSLTILKDQP